MREPTETSRIEVRARSESMNKWIGIFEEELDLEAEGSTPTERMTEIIAKLRELTDDEGALEEMERFVRRRVIAWYRIGARRGAAEFVRLLFNEGILDDEQYQRLPESLEWRKRIRYLGFDGTRKSIKKRTYSADLTEI